MSTVYDYIDWRGDLSFEQAPFNHVDNIIFASLTYFDFHEDDANCTLGEIADKINSAPEGTYVSSVPDFFTLDLVTKVGSCARFKDVRLRYFESRLSEEESIQFAAMHFDMGHAVYIGFRGTDNTILGWKEDLMLAFTVMPAEEYTVKYLLNTMDPARKYYIGGHSKGGILAVYGAMNLAPALQDQVIKVFDNDGPGLAKEILKEDAYLRISDRIVRIIPEFCVVGMIFEHKASEDHIVACDAFGILQHNMVKWQVMGSGFMEVTDIHPTARMLDEVMNNWVESLPIEERAQCITDCVNFMYAEGYEKVTEIDTPLKFERLVINMMRKLSGKTKDTLKKVRSVALKEITDKENVQELLHLNRYLRFLLHSAK